jgi:lipoprotein-anchoring transpeptidase ErfK/SrfK
MQRTNPLAVAALGISMLAASGAALAETSPTAHALPNAASLPAAPTPERSWTARIEYPVAARRTPGGRVVTRLQHYTPYSRRPAIYMVTESRRVARGRVWIRIQLPLRPNGSQGWVPIGAVTLRAHTTWVRISQRARTVNVFTAGRRIKTFRAAVGTGGTPTPSGLFAVHDVVPVSGQLGPYILTLTAHSRVLRTFAGGDGTIGIHGWPDSGALGKAVSHGCVRMSRTGVHALTRWASAGVPVEIVA